MEGKIIFCLEKSRELLVTFLKLANTTHRLQFQVRNHVLNNLSSSPQATGHGHGEQLGHAEAELLPGFQGNRLTEAAHGHHHSPMETHSKNRLPGGG